MQRLLVVKGQLLAGCAHDDSKVVVWVVSDIIQYLRELYRQSLRVLPVKYACNYHTNGLLLYIARTHEWIVFEYHAVVLFRDVRLLLVGYVSNFDVLHRFIFVIITFLFFLFFSVFFL